MILRSGGLDCSVYDRSVKKRLTGVQKNEAAKAGNAPAALAETGTFETASSVQTVEAAWALPGTIAGAVNTLAAKGAAAETISAEVLLPAGSEEAFLREIVDRLKAQAQRAAVKVEGFHAEVTGSVTRPVMFITAKGRRCWPLQEGDFGCREILVIGYVGMEGTALLARARRQELEQRFPARFLEQAAALEEELLLTQAAEAMERLGINASCCVPVLTDGIYAALWDLADECRCGFDVELTRIPLLQETIELTDYYGINPYQLRSAGAMLAVVKDAEAAAERLGQAGIFARSIGTLSAERDRRIRNGEEVQSLNRPEADSILQVLDKERLR